MVESITKVQAEIMHGISNNLSISNIAKHRKVSRQAIYKAIKPLMEKGLVNKIGTIYGLTKQGGLGLHSFMGLNRRLRQHNIAVKIKILEDHKNWDKKRNIIMQTPYFNKRINLKNTSYDLLNFGKVRIKTTSKSIIFYLPTIFSRTVEEALLQLMDILFDTIPKIENRFKIKLIKDNKINMTLISQEYARLNDALARIYRKEGNKIYITGEDGKIWLIADYSFATSELETIHPNKSDDDMTTVHTFFNDLRKSPTTFTEVKDTVQGMLQVQANNQATIEHLSLNLKKHFEVLDKLGKAVDELRKKIKKK